MAGWGLDIDRMVTDQRVTAIKELPYHGDYWAYSGPEFDDDGSITTDGSYEITDKGKVLLGGAAVGLLALFWVVSRG